MYAIFGAAANAHASGLNPTDPALKEAMRLAVLEMSARSIVAIPWTLFIVNYAGTDLYG